MQVGRKGAWLCSSPDTRCVDLNVSKHRRTCWKSKALMQHSRKRLKANQSGMHQHCSPRPGSSLLGRHFCRHRPSMHASTLACRWYLASSTTPSSTCSHEKSGQCVRLLAVEKKGKTRLPDSYFLSQTPLPCPGPNPLFGHWCNYTGSFNSSLKRGDCKGLARPQYPPPPGTPQVAGPAQTAPQAPPQPHQVLR